MTTTSLNSFVTLFNKDHYEITENFNEVKVVIESTTNLNLQLNTFEEGLSFLNQRDNLLLSVIIGDNDPIDFYLGDSKQDFVSELNKSMLNREEENIITNITISKKQVGGVISIYNIEIFLTFLGQLSLLNMLAQFNDFLKGNFLQMEQQLPGQIVETSSIFLSNLGNQISPVPIERNKLIDKGRSIGFSQFYTNFQLVPEDFIIKKNNSHLLSRLLGRIALACSAAYLFDQFTIGQSEIQYKLTGYKVIQGISDFSSIGLDPNSQFEKIYLWVYNAPNFNDRIGLARNIISLHLQPETHLAIIGSPYTALASAYKVYEKENIKQYITIRNNLSEQLLKIHDRANSLADAFASGLQKNGLALISFYISVIVLKVVSKDHLTNVFTLDTSVFSTVIIICSFFYLWFSRWELKNQKERFSKQYFELKRRNLDLLDAQDIKRILNDDREFLQDMDFIKTKLKNYSIMWICFLVLMLISTWFLFFWYS